MRSMLLGSMLYGQHFKPDAEDRCYPPSRGGSALVLHTELDEVHGDKDPVHLSLVDVMTCRHWGLRASFFLSPCNNLSLLPQVSSGGGSHDCFCGPILSPFDLTYHVCSSVGDEPHGVIIHPSLFSSSDCGEFGPSGNHSCPHAHQC